MQFLSKNLKYLRKLSGKTQAETASQLGFKGTTYNNYETGTSKPGLEDFILISNYFGVSETDLIHKDIETTGNLSVKHVGYENMSDGNVTGKGKGNRLVKEYSSKSDLSMVNEPLISTERIPKVITVDSQGKENVVMVPVKARAGYLNGYGDPKFIETLPAYRLPGLNNGTYRLFEVKGVSMFDTLNSGDIVISSYVEQLFDVRDDRVYVVVTKNEGVVIKRVLNRLKTDGKLILKSDNYKDRDDYPTIVCNQDDILEMWYGIGYISRIMRPPSEMYKRVIDLEGRLTLLENGIVGKLK